MSKTEAREWRGAFVVSLSRASSSTIPKSVVVHANILYNYLPSPNTRIAYQFYQNGQTVADASPTLVRTDLQNPCLVQRAVQCTSGCVQISETLLIPRFFAESTDVDSTGGSTCATSQYSGRASLAGCTCYEKRYASPPYGAQVSGVPFFVVVCSFLSVQVPEMIKYIWVVNSGNFEPCAAEAFDGTFYEFFRSSALTVGVNAVGVAPTMPTMTSCTSSVCSTPLELGILIDEQSTCTADDYTRINYFVYQIITSFPINPSSRFGIAYTQSVNDAGQFTNLVSTDASAWRVRGGGGGGVFQQRRWLTTCPLVQALLGCPNPPCPSPVGVAHVRKGSVGANIYTAVTNAMNKWWPTTPSTGVKREVLTIVCGGTTGTAGERATMTSTFTNLGVERWAIGVGAGASSTTLLADLASQNQYYHYIAVASSLVLGNQLQLQSQLLCPQESLCGSNCRGICTCTSPTNRVCQCPTCATSFCLPATCVSPSAGCIATPNACSDNNLCTNDKCNVATQAVREPGEGGERRDVHCYSPSARTPPCRAPLETLARRPAATPPRAARSLTRRAMTPTRALPTRATRPRAASSLPSRATTTTSAPATRAAPLRVVSSLPCRATTPTSAPLTRALPPRVAPTRP